MIKCPACEAVIPRKLVKMNFLCPRCRADLKLNGLITYVFVVLLISIAPYFILQNMIFALVLDVSVLVSAILLYYFVVLEKSIGID